MNRAARRTALARPQRSPDVGPDLERILLTVAERLSRWLDRSDPPLPGYVVICEHAPGVITLALDTRATIESLLAAIDPAAAARFAEKRPREGELLGVVISRHGEAATIPIRRVALVGGAG